MEYTIKRCADGKGLLVYKENSEPVSAAEYTESIDKYDPDFWECAANTEFFNELLRMVKKLEYRCYISMNLNSRKLEFRRTRTGFVRYIGDMSLGNPEDDFFIIRNISICKDKLSVEGAVGFYGIGENSNIGVELNVNADAYSAMTASRDHRRKMGISMRVVTFEVSAPLIEDMDNYTMAFIISIDDKSFIEQKLCFDKYSPINNKYKNSYFYSNGWSLKIKDEFIIIKKCSCDDRRMLEDDFQKELIRHNKYAAELRREAISKKKENDKKDKSIWLISDKVFAAGDNGEALFRYIVSKKNDEVQAYFVIRKESSDFSRVAQYGNVVELASEEHKKLILQADVIISSHMTDIFRNPFREKFEPFRDMLHIPFILLEHGVSHGKDFHTWMSRSNKMLHAVCVASHNEKMQFTEDKYGFTEDRIWVTGLPRFDYLTDYRKKVITVMPTWREGLCQSKDEITGWQNLKKGFRDSDYAVFYKNLMGNKKLKAKAKQLGYIIKFKIHPLFTGKEKEFGFDDEVLFSDLSYTDIFSESSLIVTDYSSVAYDFAYLDKPVIYAQFDIDCIVRSRHTYSIEPWYKYEEYGLGEIETTVDGTAERIIEYMKNDCIMKDVYRKRADRFFAYRDKKNCERVYDSVKNSLRLI